MNPIFYGAYERLYQEFELKSSDVEQNFAYEAKRIIDEAIDELQLGEMVRPDARHFLLVNFHQFILMPAYLASRRLDISSTEVFQSLRTDARTILLASADLARQRDRSEISGHIVLDSISRSWEFLKSTFYEFWDC